MHVTCIYINLRLTYVYGHMVHIIYYNIMVPNETNISGLVDCSPTQFRGNQLIYNVGMFR